MAKKKTSADLIPIFNIKALVSMNNSLVLDKSKSSCNNQLLTLDSVNKSLVNFETITLRKDEQLFSTKGDESIYRNDPSEKLEGATVRCFPIGMVYPNRHVMQYHMKTFANVLGFEMHVKNRHCECNKGSSKQVRKDRTYKNERKRETIKVGCTWRVCFSYINYKNQNSSCCVQEVHPKHSSGCNPSPDQLVQC